MPEATRNRVRRTGLMRFRDIVRIFFIFSLLGLDVITEHLFGQEIEFESEFVVLLSMLLFGSFFCGWACPYGNISYYLQKLGRRTLPRWQFRLPTRWDRPLRYLKYAMLAGFVAVFITQRISYFDDHFEMYESTWFSRVYFITLVFSVLVLSLVSERFYALSFSLHLHPVHFQMVAQEIDFTIMATAWFPANPRSVAGRALEW